jgi:hypothetical protein
MSYTLIRLVVAFTLLFTIPILLIHAQPYDDSQLRTFLTPADGCPAPCFMNIQPGITTLRDAAQYLETSREVESSQSISYQLYELHFDSGTAPIQQAKIYLMATAGLRVERINLFDTGLPLSRIFLAMGKPGRIIVYSTIRFNVMTLVVFYPEYDLYALVDLPLCSVDQLLLWDNRRDVSLGIGLWRADTEQPDYYLYALEVQPDSWAKVLRDLKRERCP